MLQRESQRLSRKMSGFFFFFPVLNCKNKVLPQFQGLKMKTNPTKRKRKEIPEGNGKRFLDKRGRGKMGSKQGLQEDVRSPEESFE